MSGNTDPFLAAAFFDSPNLLAVRFARDAQTPRSGTDRVSSFAIHRRPDAGSGIDVAGVIKVVGVGALAALIGIPLLRGCAGTTRYAAPPVIIGESVNDSSQSPNWHQDLFRLADKLSPKRTDLRPFYVRTLLDVPRELFQRGDATGGWLKPRCTPEDRIAHLRGIQLAKMLTDAGAGRDLAVILDLPGPAAVAAAAGMADHFDPVFTFDNLPHPSGVVASAQTLAAAVYWRSHLVAATLGRPADAPAVFVLEGDRLAPYHNEVDRFDNRSTVKMPDAAALKKLGVSRIVYVRAQRGQVIEADDLNELFTALPAAGIELRYLALDSVDDAQKPKDPARASTYHPHHWFWNNYGWYRPTGTQWDSASNDDARQRTAPRQTMFSGLTSRPGFDGGNSQRATVLSRLAPPPPSTTTSGGSGGSWFRSSGHRSSG